MFFFYEFFVEFVQCYWDVMIINYFNNSFIVIFKIICDDVKKIFMFYW